MKEKQHSKVSSTVFNELSSSLHKTNLSISEKKKTNADNSRSSVSIFGNLNTQQHPTTPMNQNIYQYSSQPQYQQSPNNFVQYQPSNHNQRQQYQYTNFESPEKNQQYLPNSYPYQHINQHSIFNNQYLNSSQQSLNQPRPQFETPQIVQYQTFQHTPQNSIQYQAQPQLQPQSQSQQLDTIPSTNNQTDINANNYYYHSYQKSQPQQSQQQFLTFNAQLSQPSPRQTALLPPPPIPHQPQNQVFNSAQQFNQHTIYPPTNPQNEKESPLSSKYISPTQKSNQDLWNEGSRFSFPKQSPSFKNQKQNVTQPQLPPLPPPQFIQQINDSSIKETSAFKKGNRAPMNQLDAFHKKSESYTSKITKNNKPSLTKSKNKSSKSVKIISNLDRSTSPPSDKTQIKSKATQDYLNYYSSSVNLSRQLLWSTSILPEVDKFQQYISNNELMNKYLNNEKSFQDNGEMIDLNNFNNYKIEEFYKYVRDFPKHELVKLSEIFGLLSNLFNNWIGVKDSAELQKLDFEYFYNNSAALFQESGMDSDRLTNTYIKHDKSQSVPGESVSLQVIPIKPNTGISDNFENFNSQGTLHPDLSIKVKIVCQHCGCTKTPEWRKGPEDARTLCNACGLFHTKLVKKLGVEAAANEMKRRRENGEETNRRM